MLQHVKILLGKPGKSRGGGAGSRKLVRKKLLWPPLDIREDEAKMRNSTEAIGPSTLGARTEGSDALNPEPGLSGLLTEGLSPSQARESAGLE